MAKVENSKYLEDAKAYRERLLYAIGVSLIFCLLIAFYIFIYSCVKNELFCQNEDCDPPAFKVSEITISRDLRRTSLYEIIEASKIKRGEYIMNLNFAQVAEDVAKLPWVDTVRVMRFFPERIVLEISEREPIAMLFDGTAYYPVDIKGEIVRKAFSDPQDLFVIMGNNANKNIIPLAFILKDFPNITDRIVSSMWVGNRRWDLYIDDEIEGINVKLPETGMVDALKMLAKKHEEEQILNRNISEIDLRVPGRVSVKLKEKIRKL